MAEYCLAWRRLDGESGHDVGRQLLAELYDRYVGGNLPAVAVTDRGKPYFVDSPWHFSISHCKNHAFCALCHVPVGVDAEEMDRDVRLSIGPKILSSGELAQLHTSKDPRKTLLTFWVLKEATAKHSGKGIGFHPRNTDFVLPDSRVQEIDGCLVAVIW